MKEKVHEQAHIHDTPPLLDNATYNGRICIKYTNNLILKWGKIPKIIISKLLAGIIYAFVFKNNKILNSKVQNFQKNNAIEIYPGNLYICIFCSKKFQKKILGSVITDINTCIHINTMDPKYQNSFFETLCSRTDWLTDWLMVKNTIVPWGIIKFSYVLFTVKKLFHT